MDEHERIVGSASLLYMHANPLHADIFQLCRRMEVEVVAMIAGLLGGDRVFGLSGSITR